MAVDTLQAPPAAGAAGATHTIVHYELGAKDASKLTAFYSAVFGWTFSSAPGMEDYKMADAGGVGIGIYAIEDPNMKPTNYIGVSSVKEYAEKIKASGGTVIHEFAVPNMGLGAMALDPEGNPIGIWQADSNAGSYSTKPAT
jgi:predicted enzyme related to lactoylglutathione lyase